MLDFNEELIEISERLDIKEIKEIEYFPRYLEIEAYDGCNLNCVMCPLGKDIYDAGGGIPLDLFNEIVEQLRDYSDWIKLVCLSRNGEPLLNKNVPKMVKKLKDVGIKRVNFSTNATALTEKKSYELLNAGLDEIRLSIDGYTKETFEKVRKDANYDRILKNSLNFIKIRDKMNANTQVQIRFVEQKANTNEVQDWKNFWLSKVKPTDVVASKKMHSWGNKLDSFEGQIDSDFRKPCISPFSTLEILHDGTVPLCGCDYKPTVILGNVKRNTLLEIWNGEKFKKIRELHATGKRNDISICVGCRIWDTKKIKTVYHKNIEKIKTAHHKIS